MFLHLSVILFMVGEGSLCRGVSVQGGLCAGGLCAGGLCPGGSLCRGCLCPGVSVQGVVSVQEVSVRETSPYGNMQVVHILLECIFVFIIFMKILHPGGRALTSDWSVNGTCIDYLSPCRKNLLIFLQRSMRNKFSVRIFCPKYD